MALVVAVAGVIKTAATIKTILSAMGLPTSALKLCPARPPPTESGADGGGWLNRRDATQAERE